MKRFALLLVACVAFPVFASAQRPESDHFQVGAYADYFHLSQTNTNLAGLGGRLTFTAYRQLKLEGEMNYDFNQVFTERFTDSAGGSVAVNRSNLRLLHGLFGPKLELGHSSFHPFVTAKGGFANFRLDNRPATFDTFFSSVDNLRSKDVSAVFYPSGGLEGHLGPVGLRLDVGDEIYFSGGAHHNVRVAFGPYIRF